MKMPGVRAISRMQKMIEVRSPAECWPWRGRPDDQGYGFIKVWGTTTRAHRVAWALANGHWPPAGLLIRHTCDNPPCCNPDHLLIGTSADNMRDSVERGRRPRGERCGSSQLSEAQVRQIRQRAAAGESHGSIAREIGFTRQGISAVVNRKNWRHVA